MNLLGYGTKPVKEPELSGAQKQSVTAMFEYDNNILSPELYKKSIHLISEPSKETILTSFGIDSGENLVHVVYEHTGDKRVVVQSLYLLQDDKEPIDIKKIGATDAAEFPVRHCWKNL
ncbi:MAG: hypothetical protein KAJ91_02960 [Candidatus Aenigmarchaeota archaeon]|nr:hypothetical protein [Candidatus Aenigmarchaeota archaeon]MCK5332977.1 hypothetical protein [Candidatus Aenigmarchaeota archaeon]